jgi:hypothetical protein
MNLGYRYEETRPILEEITRWKSPMHLMPKKLHYRPRQAWFLQGAQERRRRTLQLGLWFGRLDGGRPNREETSIPLLAGERSFLDCSTGLQFQMPALPELEHIAGER